MKKGKKYIASAELIESAKLYDPAEAMKLACETTKAKFDVLTHVTLTNRLEVL